jgi:putative addiction module killer protein
MTIEIAVYEDSRGERPFDLWFDRLPAAYAAKVAVAVRRMADGNRSAFKPVGGGVAEWRIDWGPGLRVYLGFDGARLIILLAGGTKTRQQADVAEAIDRWGDYRRRKKSKE